MLRFKLLTPPAAESVTTRSEPIVFTTVFVAMARYRIIRRPDQEVSYANNFEVEELAPYMSPSGECIATYWQLIAGPFPVLDYAEIYVEKAMEIEKDQRFVVKEYDS